MASLELKGKIAWVGPVHLVGENRTQKQEFIFFVPGYVDGFGDKVGRDENWKISIMGENVAKIGMEPRLTVDKKAKVKIYLNSNYLPFVEGKEPVYIINAVLASIEIL